MEVTFEEATKDYAIDKELNEADALWRYATDDKAPFGSETTIELANYIGRIIYGYSAIEYQFYTLYAIVSDDDPEVSFIKFYKARTIRMKEIFALNEARILPFELQTALKALWGRLRGAADLRTRVAHCVIIQKEDGFLSVQLSGDKAKFDNFDSTKMEKTHRQFRILQTDVHMFLVCLRLWNPVRCDEKLKRFSLPKHAFRGIPSIDPGILPKEVESARDASLKRLGLHRSLLIVESRLYPILPPYDLRFCGQLVLWINPA